MITDLQTTDITCGVGPLGYVAFRAPSLKARAQIREEFASKGRSISAWAKSKGYSPNLVIAILADKETNPRLKCLRGDAHNIAVELGLKEGQVSRLSQQLAA